MTVRAWRLCDDRFAASMWTGLGAWTHGGRWNSRGVTMVYSAATRSLAALEQLVHMVPPRVLSGYVFASVELDESQIEEIDAAKLPAGWDGPISGPATRAIGDAWVSAGRSLALAVPSVVMAGESNYLINPAHRDFTSAKLTGPIPFAHDPRFV